MSTRRQSTPSLRDTPRGVVLHAGVVALSAVVLSLLTSACGSSSASGGLECEEEGYPCALADVPVEILERSNELGDQALTMLEGGASTADVTTWLGEQPEMAEVGADELVVRFRLAGGRGHWILAEGALATRGTRVPAAAAPTEPAEERRLAFVVGEESEQKSALVLSPVLWEFGPTDAGDRVAAILRGTKGYESGVTQMKNATQADRRVDVDSFTAWGKYQTIYVDSHGARYCDAPPCRAVIIARALSEPESTAAKLGELPVTGVGVGVSPGRKYLILDADFFRSQYPGGLKDTVVFFNACETYGSEATDLADAIRGSTGIFLGWDEPVQAGPAAATGVALYEELSKGHTVERAHSNLGGLRTDPRGSQLVVATRQEGGDLRIREIVSVLDPQSEQVLTAADTIGIEGEARDGQPDGAPYLVQVDGMPAESASDALLHVSIDGVEAEPRPVSSGEAKSDDPDTWLLGGVIPLGYDLEQDTTVTYRAWVELPSGGESDHETSATLTGDSPIMGTTWELVAENVYAKSATIRISPWKSTARLTLTFAPGQDPKEPKPRYVVTGGTVRIDYNHTYYDCTVTADPLTVDLSDPRWAGDSSLMFDTTARPVTYGGVLATTSPKFTVRQACVDSGSGSRSQSLLNVWFIIDPGEFRAVSRNRKKIDGTYRSGGAEITNESTYTLTRID